MLTGFAFIYDKIIFLAIIKINRSIFLRLVFFLAILLYLVYNIKEIKLRCSIKKKPASKDAGVAGAIRIELISLVLETKAQPLYQTPKQQCYYIIKKRFCQLFLRHYGGKFYKIKKHF